MGAQAALRISYQAPRIEVTEYSGPAAPLRPLTSAAAVDIYRFALEHFAAVSAKSVVIPTVTAKMAPAGSSAVAGTGDYTLFGRRAARHQGRQDRGLDGRSRHLHGSMTAAGKTEKLTGEVANLAAYDFDAAATRMMLDPAHAKDDKYYRAYRQMTAGPYTASFEKGLRMRVESVTVDDVGLRPSKLQFPDLMAIIEAGAAARHHADAGTDARPARQGRGDL